MNAATDAARAQFAGPSNWSAQERLGAHLTGGPSIASRTPDVMTVFYRGENNHLWNVAWSAKAGFGVGRDMGGPPIASHPCAVSRASDHMEVFYRGENDHLCHRWWTPAAFSDHQDLGGVALTSHPTAVSRTGNDMDVFYRGPNGHLWRRPWSVPTGFGSDSDLGGVTLSSSPAAVSRSADRMDIFFQGPNTHLFQRTWISGSLSEAQDLGVALHDAPAVASRDADNIEVAFRRADNTLWHMWWGSAFGWTDPERLDALTDASPGLITRSPDHLEIFYRGLDGALWHQWLTPTRWYVLPCLFANTGTPRYDREWLKKFFGPAGLRSNGVHDWFRAVSYGRNDLAAIDVRDWKTLGYNARVENNQPIFDPPLPVERDDSDLRWSIIKEAMSLHGVRPAHGEHVLTVIDLQGVFGGGFPRTSGYGPHAVGDIGDPQETTADAFEQEMFHGLGQYHADDDTGVEYGDHLDVMGSPGNVHFPGFDSIPSGPAVHASCRRRLGWVPASRILMLERGKHTQGNQVKLAALHRGGGELAMVMLVDPPGITARPGVACNSITIEFRMRAGFDRSLPADGIRLLWDAEPSSFVIGNPASQWGTETDIGGAVDSAPAALGIAGNQELDLGTFTVFYRRPDGSLGRRGFDGSGWGPEDSLRAHIAGAPAVVELERDQVEVFYRGPDDHLYRQSFGGARKSPVEDMGGLLTSSPAVASRGHDHMEVFYRGQNGHLWHRWWTASGGWSGQEDLQVSIHANPTLGTPAAAATSERMEVLYCNAAGRLVRLAWTPSGWQSEYSLMDAPFGSPCVFVRQVGRPQTPFQDYSQIVFQAAVPVRDGFATLCADDEGRWTFGGMTPAIIGAALGGASRRRDAMAVFYRTSRGTLATRDWQPRQYFSAGETFRHAGLGLEMHVDGIDLAGQEAIITIHW